MKKVFVYLLAVVAFLGFVSTASAGPVVTIGNTSLSVGGFILGYYGESYNQSLVSAQADNPGMINSNVDNTTRFSGTLAFTRLWANLDNKPEGLTGYVSLDFNGGGIQGTDQGIRLRRAYLVKSFCSGNCDYSPWIEIGQDYNLGQPVGFTLAAYQNAGLAGDEASVPIWVPQVDFGVKFKSGNVELNPEIAIMDLQGESGSENYTTFMNSTSFATYESASTVNATIPGFGIKLPLTFKTGFGAPSSIYVAYEDQDVNVNAVPAILAPKKTMNGYSIGGGLTIPVSYVTLVGDIQYTNGMTGLNTILLNTLGTGGVAYTPSSYYWNGNNLQSTKAVQWDAQAQVHLNKFIGAPVTVAGGYSQVSFHNYQDDQNLNLGNSYAAWSAYSSAPVDKTDSIFVNVEWNVTKSMMLGLEWDNNRTNYSVDSDQSFNSNALYMVGMYSF